MIPELEHTAVYQGDQCLIDGSLLPLKRAIWSVSVNPYPILAAVPGKKLRVLSVVVGLGTTDAISFASNSTLIWGGDQMIVNTGQPLVLPLCPAGWFETSAGEALKVATAADAQSCGALVYVEVPA